MDTGMKKILAVVVVLALLTVGVAVGEHYKSNETNTNSFSLVARVNAEGSSVFVAESYLEELQAKGVVIRDYSDLSGVFYDLENGVAVPNDKYAGNWNNMVIGTPGNTSIQHKMIQQFVEKMSYNGEQMRFERYEQGAAPQDGVVYYDTTLTNLNIWNTSSHMDAGTIWQPVCGAIEASSEHPAVRIMSSAQMEPNHACCVIGAVDSYLANNENTVVRFLAAYIESVTAVNNAITAGTGNESYEDLVQLAVDQTGQTRQVVETAFKEVVYTYGLMSGTSDTETNPLNSLRENTASLADMFASDGTFRRTLESLGFGDSSQFADAFVNDYYLSKAIQLVKDVRDGKVDPSSFNSTRIRVGVIAGDVHQIAIHYGMNYGDGEHSSFFTKYGVSVTLDAATNGAGVATSLQNGAVSLGFLGLPPASTTVVNSALIQSSQHTVSGTVTDADGAPVADKEVTFLDSDGTTVMGTATTDADGRYTMQIRVGATGSVVCEGASVTIIEVFRDTVADIRLGGGA